MIRKRTLSALSLGFLFSAALPGLALAAPPQARAADALTEASDVAARPRAGTEREIARYRAREAASPRAQSYRGGDGVVIIGATTVTIVLSVVLLVVLL